MGRSRSGFSCTPYLSKFSGTSLSRSGSKPMSEVQSRQGKGIQGGAGRGHPVSGDGHPVGGGDICGDGQGQVGDELGPKHPPSSYADPYQIYTSIYESGILCGYEENGDVNWKEMESRNRRRWWFRHCQRCCTDFYSLFIWW